MGIKFDGYRRLTFQFNDGWKGEDEHEQRAKDKRRDADAQHRERHRDVILRRERGRR